jgi:hypothetical protein
MQDPFIIQYSTTEKDNNVQVFSFSIQRRKKIFFNINNKDYKCICQSIEIICKSEPTNIIGDNMKFFEIAIDGKRGQKLTNIELCNDDTQVDLYLNLNEVKINKDNLDKQHVIETFDLELILTTNKKFQRKIVQKTSSRIQINKHAAVLQIDFWKDKDFSLSSVYSNNTRDIGVLSIRNIAPIFSYNLHIEDLTLNTNPFSEAIEIAANNAGHNNKMYGITKSGIYINNIKPQNEWCAKLILDESKLHRPFNKSDKYNIFSEGKKKTINEFTNIDLKTDIGNCLSFELEPNIQKTELIVYYYPPNDLSETVITETNTCNALGNIKIKPNKTDTKYSILNLFFGNKAQLADTDRTSLDIIDPRIDIIPESNDCPHIDVIQQLSKTLSARFEIKNGDNWKPARNLSRINLPNTFDSYIHLVIEVSNTNHTILENLKGECAQFEAILSFKYLIIDSEGLTKYQDGKKYNFSFNISEDEGIDWLAIDFGTSAIHCHNGNTKINNKSINLRSQLKKLAENYKDSDYDDAGSPFLPANILLRDSLTCIKPSKSFKNSFIQFCPNIFTLLNNYAYTLPYPKSLVGYKNLPKVFLDRITRVELLKHDTAEAYKSIEVGTIFEEVYHILLNDFILPSATEGQIKPNKVVLTVPNSFTTRHKKMIREVVENVFKKTIWPQYIRFISESDAVACYYYAKKDEINKRKGSDASEYIKSEIGSEDSSIETVLVYDMGAGTLDLTLFTITKYQSDKEIYTELKIKGRLGQTLAGNYADYIIADEVSKQLWLDEDFNQIGFLPTSNYADFPIETAEFRAFIKEELKPRLSPQGTLKGDFLVLNNQKISKKNIDFNKIINSEAYKNFLTNVTSDALKTLKQCFGLDSTHINTLVCSGRGVQLYGLKQKLEEALAETFNCNPTKITLSKSELKTCVAEGAVFYAKISKIPSICFVPLNIPCRYGLLLHKIGGTWKYLEVINSTSHEGSYTFDSSERFGAYYQHQFNSLSSYFSMSIIQTYLTPDTITENINNREIIFEKSTEICQYNQNDFLDGKNLLTILVGSDGEVYISFNSSIEDGRAISTIDVNESKSFRKSMWPYL